MLQYTGSIQSLPPVDDASRNAALGAIRKRSPFTSFGQNHQDVLDALGERAAATLGTESRRANADYLLQQQNAQRQLALSGLNQLAQSQQNDNQLANTRLQNMVGFAGGLLRGLF
jgi:hypothetical protein